MTPRKPGRPKNRDPKGAPSPAPAPRKRNRPNRLVGDATPEAVALLAALAWALDRPQGEVLASGLDALMETLPRDTRALVRKKIGGKAEG